MQRRREFIKTFISGTTAAAIGGLASGISPRSYMRIIGSNDRIGVAIIGLGRRYGEYKAAIANKENKIDLLYLCDVMKSQREKAAGVFSGVVSNRPVLENDIRKILDDPEVDAILNAAPDHWHTPGSCMAMEAGKDVYVEKPCSHNPYETELLNGFQKKYGRIVQMGNQYRSVPHIQDIVNEIHKGLIGETYKAVSFLSSNRGELPKPVRAPVPGGLDWDLFQGPSPRTEYTHLTWDYNWHWYGWNYGTGEVGNNGIHEIDIARWALNVDYPDFVDVEAGKHYFVNDGWTMYDTMEATFRFHDNKIIKWDGKSRSGYRTYGSPRGVIVFGQLGTVSIDPFKFKVFDREGKQVTEKSRLVDADDGTTAHIENFFNAVRGKEKLNSPVEIGRISNLLCNYANISYRIGKSFGIDPTTGHIPDKEAMKLWKREYEPGWEPVIP